MEAEVYERYLRPKAVAEAAKTSSWGESESVWIPDEQEGFVLGKPVKGEPGKLELELNGAIVDTKDGVERSNPSRCDRTEDMASMTELNEATVLHNLKRRYASNLIYTHSGLFLVAINPYKQLPIYGDPVIAEYKNHSESKCPPHIFSTADAALKAMLEGRRNQSILITGESGAGKTENTKRVIQYLAKAASKSATDAGVVSLEERIIQANPIMEAFGNAQTIRNNNSSRFVIMPHFVMTRSNTLSRASSSRSISARRG